MCMYVYNISGGGANIFYKSCAQIDNNQQVYEAQIQVPKCKKGITTPLLFCYFVSSWKTILIINFWICCKSNVSFSSH